MSKCVVGALVLFIVLPSIAAAQSTKPAGVETFRLAFVSPQRAFYESNDGKAAQSRLESLQSRRPKNSRVAMHG